MLQPLNWGLSPKLPTNMRQTFNKKPTGGRPAPMGSSSRQLRSSPKTQQPPPKRASTRSSRAQIRTHNAATSLPLANDCLPVGEPTHGLFGMSLEEYTLGGILTMEEADRTGSAPGPEDVQLFKKSLLAVPRVNLIPEISYYRERAGEGPRKRGRKRRADLIAEQDPRTIVFSALHLGSEWMLYPKYFSPLPEEYFTTPNRHVWSCPACLKFFRSRQTYECHAPKCLERTPPGQEIYRRDDLSVFEVNGRFSVKYCQRLCLIAKMFLDHKSVYYDTETFLFYLLIQRKPFTMEEAERAGIEWQPDLYRWHLIGYFSKEKANPHDYNLSCILTLPQYQRHGYGTFLIDLSYLLSRREGKLGSPEKPLSDSGLVGYTRYWTFAVVGFLKQKLAERSTAFSLADICQDTGMIAEDVLLALERIDGIHQRDGRYVIDPPLAVIQRHRPLRVAADPNCLSWAVYTCPL